jgi:hypothetical protein
MHHSRNFPTPGNTIHCEIGSIHPALNDWYPSVQSERGHPALDTRRRRAVSHSPVSGRAASSGAKRRDGALADDKRGRSESKHLVATKESNSAVNARDRASFASACLHRLAGRGEWQADSAICSPRSCTIPTVPRKSCAETGKRVEYLYWLWWETVRRHPVYRRDIADLLRTLRAEATGRQPSRRLISRRLLAPPRSPSELDSPNRRDEVLSPLFDSLTASDPRQRLLSEHKPCTTP